MMCSAWSCILHVRRQLKRLLHMIDVICMISSAQASILLLIGASFVRFSVLSLMLGYGAGSMVFVRPLVHGSLEP